MITFLIAISPFALLGFVVAAWLVKDWIDTLIARRRRKNAPKPDPTPIKFYNGYDSNSPMVQHFQYYAGITDETPKYTFNAKDYVQYWRPTSKNNIL